MLVELGTENVNDDAVESILADFRAWLREAKEIPLAEPPQQLDVASILQHFIALRQEINLQTRASRTALEQNAQALGLLQQSLAQNEEVEDSSDEQDEAKRPLLKTLIEAHDALMLAHREVERLLAQAAPPRVEIRLPLWARMLGLGAGIDKQIARLRAERGEQAERYQQVLEALRVGYQMSLQRLERAFAQQGLEAIPCVGEPFDPESMEVVEVVREPERSSTEVQQEIRRGYTWHGRLFRCAQVRVASP